MSDAGAAEDRIARGILRELHAAAIAAVVPGPAIARHLPERPRGRCVVIGAGKASAAMAAAFDRASAQAWGAETEVSGVVATRYGHAISAGRIDIIEAGHPVPDANSLRAAQRIMSAVTGLGPDDLVVALISGGGSAVMEWPIAGLDLDGLQALGRALLNCGASIREMNIVRRHLSQVKGGRLAVMAAPARVVTLLISDIPGDDATAIASGPTLADNSTPDDAADLIQRYGLPVAGPVVAAMRSALPVVLDVGEARTIASSHQALSAAGERAVRLGLSPLILGDALEGEARELGRAMAGMALSARQWGQPIGRAGVLLSGGEATVTLDGDQHGKGGRNTEFALSLAVSLDGAAGVYALAADSDGIDGSEDAAGAIVTPDTLRRARVKGFNAMDFLSRHDSYSYFKALNDLLMTGPTLTNVNDIRIILV